MQGEGKPSKRTSRIELRAQPAREERIRYAARLANKSVSAFVLDAAAERAEDVIAAATETVVPSEYFDELLAWLDEPSKPNARLAAAARKRRRITMR